MNVFYARPIIPLLIALISGIYLGSEFPGYRWLTAGAAVLCAGFIAISVVRHRTARFAPILFFLTTGYLSLQPWVSPDFPPHHIIHYTDSQRWEIEGVVESRPIVSNGRQKFILRAQRLENGNEIRSVTGKLRVTVAGEKPQLYSGDAVSFRSSIRSIRNFNNPGGFDYQRYMAFRGVWGTVYVNSDQVERIGNPSKQALWGKIDSARAHISLMIENAGKGPQIGVLKALMVGDRSAVSPAVREDFNRAGVGHLLAISGLHVGIVATVAFLFFQRVLSNFSFLLWRAWTRKGAALLALLPVCLYGLLSGLSPSTQRAVIMISIFLMTFLFEREHELINTLALAALAILIVFPPALFSISFQLSFSAVLSIVYGIKCMRKIPRDRDRASQPTFVARLRDRLVSFFFVSVFAIGGTLPLVMYYFNQISAVGIFANFIIVPLVGFIAVPVGLIGVFVSPFWLAGAAWCFKACDVILSLSLFFIRYLADLPFAALKTFTPTVFEIGCYYVLAGSLLYWITADSAAVKGEIDQFQPPAADYHKGREKIIYSRPTRLLVFITGLIGTGLRRLLGQKATGKPRNYAGTLVIIALLILAGDAGYWYYSRFWNNDLKVTFIDVGQGNAALLELPRGYTMLIDGGGFSDNSIFDMGARVLAPLLWRKKIQTVDALIISHPNSDHLNGLIYIAKHFNVRQIWTNNEDRNTFGYRALMDVIALEDITVPKFEHLPRQQTINGVALNILYPQIDFLEKKTADKWRNSNNNSMVVRISLGSISFLFPGDIAAQAEKELVHTAPENLSSSVLLAPHHGSRSSSTMPFLDSVDPQIVVISAGWKNRFRFPHTDVLKRYNLRGCRIFRIDTHGAIRMITDGQDLAVEPFFQLMQRD